MSTQNAIVENPKNIYYQYDWFQKTFPPVVQKVFDDFFEEDFTFTLFGVCKNVNTLSDKGTNFVTKVKIDQQHDLFFRMSESSIKLILDKVLGKSNRALDLSKMTELETTIITTFNDCMYRAVMPFLQPPPPTLSRMTPGTRVEILNNAKRGAVIVKFRGTRFALGSRIAEHVLVKELYEKRQSRKESVI